MDRDYLFGLRNRFDEQNVINTHFDTHNFLNSLQMGMGLSVVGPDEFYAQSPKICKDMLKNGNFTIAFVVARLLLELADREGWYVRAEPLRQMVVEQLNQHLHTEVGVEEVVRSSNICGRLLYHQGRYDEAMVYLETAYNYALQGEQVLRQCLPGYYSDFLRANYEKARKDGGDTAGFESQFEEAIRAYDSFNFFTSAADRIANQPKINPEEVTKALGVISLIRNLGVVLSETRNHAAMHVLYMAHSCSDAVNDLRGKLQATLNIGHAHWGQRDLRALDKFGRCATRGSGRLKYIALQNCAEVLLRTDDPVFASQSFSRSWSHYTALNSGSGLDKEFESRIFEGWSVAMLLCVVNVQGRLFKGLPTLIQQATDIVNRPNVNDDAKRIFKVLTCDLLHSVMLDEQVADVQQKQALVIEAWQAMRLEPAGPVDPKALADKIKGYRFG